MERAVIRGRYDRTQPTQAVKLILTAAPATGGRSRQRASNVWDTKEEVIGDIADWLTTNLPENDPAP